MLFVRSTLAIALSLLSLLAHAQPSQLQSNLNAPATSSKNFNQPTANTAATTVVQDTTTSPTELARLQTAGNQLQSALTTLQHQSNQLQTSLFLLNQQIEQVQAKNNQPETAENAKQLQSLRIEYQQAQDTLMALRQQEALLQAHMGELSKQLSQLPQKLETTTTNHTGNFANGNGVPSTPPATSSTESNVSTPAANAQSAVITNATAPLVDSSSQNWRPETSAMPISNTPDKTVNATPVVVSQKSPTSPNNTIAPKPKQQTSPATEFFSNQSVQNIKTSVLGWLQDPALMLRIGGGFVALALLLLIILFWPRTQRQKMSHQTFNPVSDTLETVINPLPQPTSTVTDEEKIEAAAEYDFMGTDAAIPTHLDLARAYIEMGKLVEARAALKPILIKGDAAQRQEALNLLGRIELVDSSSR